MYCGTTFAATSTTEESCQVMRCKPGYVRRNAVKHVESSGTRGARMCPWCLPEVAASVVEKPLLFVWDARVTAERPRGKVVKEDVFEANGCQYQFHRDREFTWEDGTLQTLERIDRNIQECCLVQAIFLSTHSIGGAPATNALNGTGSSGFALPNA